MSSLRNLAIVSRVLKTHDLYANLFRMRNIDATKWHDEDLNKTGFIYSSNNPEAAFKIAHTFKTSYVNYTYNYIIDNGIVSEFIKGMNILFKTRFLNPGFYELTNDEITNLDDLHCVIAAHFSNNVFGRNYHLFWYERMNIFTSMLIGREETRTFWSLRAANFINGICKLSVMDLIKLL